MTTNPRPPNIFIRNDKVAPEDLPPRSPLRILDTWWRGKQQSFGRLPARAELDPIELGKDLLPWLFVMEVLRGGGGLDYRFRLLGTSNIQLVGRDPTGMLASDVFKGKERSILKSSFDTTVELAEPTYWKAEIPHEQDFSVPVYRAIYPLADSGQPVDHIVAAAIPEKVEYYD